jgi:hypothetical protein
MGFVAIGGIDGGWSASFWAVMFGRWELLLSAACFFDIVQLLLSWVSWRKNRKRLEHEVWFDAYPKTRVDHIHAWRKSAQSISHGYPYIKDKKPMPSITRESSPPCHFQRICNARKLPRCKMHIIPPKRTYVRLNRWSPKFNLPQ